VEFDSESAIKPQATGACTLPMAIDIWIAIWI